jgi:hypothetical protein
VAGAVIRRRVTLLVAAAAMIGGASLAAPQAAAAVAPIGPICNVGGPLAQSACPLAGEGAGGGLASSLSAQLVLAPVEGWVVSGASFALQATSRVLGETTSPQLTSTWFSSTYWRVAAIAGVLTLPFLFAAAVQAIVRSDLGLLLRAALGYLPLALLAVAVAAPLTMLLLAASDQLSAAVSSAAGQQGADFLAHATSLLTTISVTVSSPFVVFLVGLVTVAGALVLWIELLLREAAVYVIVLMLPLAFAAFVWPARRIWAIRAIELLIALILSKFAIVAVLSLGGAALDQSSNGSVTGLLAGAVLMALAAFAPWAVLRLVPLAEVASSAAGSLSSGSSAAFQRLRQADAWAAEGNHWAAKTAQMRGAADGAGANGARATSESLAANAPSASESAEEPLEGDAKAQAATESAATEPCDSAPAGGGMQPKCEELDLENAPGPTDNPLARRVRPPDGSDPSPSKQPPSKEGI